MSGEPGRAEEAKEQKSQPEQEIERNKRLSKETGRSKRYRAELRPRRKQDRAEERLPDER